MYSFLFTYILFYLVHQTTVDSKVLNEIFRPHKWKGSKVFGDTLGILFRPITHIVDPP